MGKIILGSSSPRRSEILRKLELDFNVIPSEYVEDHSQTVFSYDFVENLAYNKALDVAKKFKNEEKLVIGADTIVVIDNKILGKPNNFENAKQMLEMLSGKTHFVVTSICVINSKNLYYHKESTTTYVKFKELTNQQIENYINDFKPFDKAGSYGIQELPEGFVESIDGEIDNVIGLSSKSVTKLLAQNYD